MSEIKETKHDSTAPDLTKRRFMTTAATAAVAAASLPFASSAAASTGAAVDNTDKEFAGKTAFITGGARGIGFAAAKELASAGANIVLFDIAGQIGEVPYELATRKDLRQARKEIRSLGVKCMTIQGDVRSSADLNQAVQQTVETFGTIDFLFANAGITQIGQIGNFTDEQIDLITDINLKGVIKTVQAAAPVMRQQQSGRIILNASITGRGAGQGFPLYSTAKWGVIGFCKNVALELGPLNITCNAICPSFVNTKLLNNDYVLGTLFPNNPTFETFDGLAQQIHNMPVGMYEPEVVAHTIKFLCSEGAKYTSGDVFDIQAAANAANIG